MTPVKTLGERIADALIEDGLRRVLKGPEAGGRRRRVLPPVSAAGGGLMPGIHLDDMSALQEMDDLMFARRLE